MIRVLDCCIGVALVLMVGVIIWRVQDDDTRRRINMNAQSRAFFPSAPAWCYPANGWQPSSPDARIRHLEECYPDLDRFAPASTSKLR